MDAFGELNNLSLAQLYQQLEVASRGMNRVLQCNKVIYRPRIRALEKRIVELEKKELS